MQEENNRGSHGLGQLIRPDRVELERKVREDNEATEGGGEGQYPQDGDPLGVEDIEPDTDLQAEGGGDEVYQGQGHAGELVVHVDQLVQHHYADGGGQVHTQAEGYQEFRRHLGLEMGTRSFLAEANGIEL